MCSEHAVLPAQPAFPLLVEQHPDFHLQAPCSPQSRGWTLTLAPGVAPALLGLSHPWDGFPERKMEWGRGEKEDKIITTIIIQDSGPTRTTDDDEAQIQG